MPLGSIDFCPITHNILRGENIAGIRGTMAFYGGEFRPLLLTRTFVYLNLGCAKLSFKGNVY